MKNIVKILIFVEILLFIIGGFYFVNKKFNNLNSEHFIIKNSISNLQFQQKLLTQNQKRFQTIDLKDYDKIIKANVVIYNDTEKSLGSGSYIKVNNKKYILTVAHLIDNVDDFMWVILDNNTKYAINLVKLNRDNDLALFKVNDINIPYLEISDILPKVGSSIDVVGNPGGELDVITNGIIAKETGNGYIISNKIFFGNSGGAALYRGKIVGVVSQIMIYYDVENKAYVNYGSAIKLKIIKEFLEDIQK